MPRAFYRNWTPEEDAIIVQMVEQGRTTMEIAGHLGRPKGSVDYRRAMVRPGVRVQDDFQLPTRATSAPLPPLPPRPAPPLPPAPALPTAGPQKTGEELTEKRDGDTIEWRSQSAKIKTVEDLLRHIEADLTKFVVAASEASRWETATADRVTGKPIVQELHRIFVRLKPKPGPTEVEAIEAMLLGSFATRTPPSAPKHKRVVGDVWQVIDLFDPHFGKYAWGKGTGGGDYDLSIAQRVVSGSALELIGHGDDVFRPVRRSFILGGDIFHYDTPGGTTTSGTPLDRDGRLPKMIADGADTIIGVIEASAATCPTDVTIIPGNHDTALTWAFHRILVERFRKDQRVTIDPAFTPRKYLVFGKNLIGAAHGDKTRKRLPQVMALEQAAAWGEAVYREIHTGHFHRQAADRQEVINTEDGVILRTAPALCPPDDWHSEMGFIGSRQAMETFFYRKSGGLVGMRVADNQPWRRAA